MPHTSQTQIDDLKKAIAAQEALRSTLGDAVVDAVLSVLQKQLAELEAQLSPPAQQRKLVTVLFADVSGFTAMSEHLDAEDVTAIMNALWQRLDQAIIEQGGRIDKHIGDAIMALWGSEISSEDDAERALRAALKMQEEVAGFQVNSIPSRSDDGMALEEPIDVKLSIRIGINTGQVLLGQVGTTSEFTAMGDTVNTASRLEHAAPVGGILISHHTFQHISGIFDVQELEPLYVKGKSEALQVYLVQRLKPRRFRSSRRGIQGVYTQMVGREAEMQRLQDALLKTAKQGRAQVITVSADAGVGKSRLVHEFEQWVDIQPWEVFWFRGRAAPHMQRLPYALLRDVFTMRFQIQESDPLAVVQAKMEAGILEAHPELNSSAGEIERRAHFIGHLLGFDFSHSPHLAGILQDRRQIFHWAQRYLVDYFRSLTRQDAAAILIEDIHWADDPSLDMLCQVVQELTEARLLLLCLARPTFFERRPLWGNDLPQHAHLTLQPLDAEASRRLAGEILQKIANLPAELSELLVKNAEGNPYYLEEMVKMLIDDGVIIKAEDAWQVHMERLHEIHVPETLTSLLQARLDSLPPEEHTVLQQASVVGRVFWDQVVGHLYQSTAGQPELQQMQTLLASLDKREMVFLSDQSVFENTQEYLFKHATLREVTYESVLKRLRRDYHAQVAAWLSEQSGSRMEEMAGLIAEHYELAGQNEQAVTYLLKAGRHAAAQYANAEALHFFSRALQLVSPDEIDLRCTLLLARTAIYHLQGDRGPQIQDLDTLDSLAPALDAVQRSRIALARTNYEMKVNNFPAALQSAQSAAEFAQIAKDETLLANSYTAWGTVFWMFGAYGEARAKLEQGLNLARQTRPSTSELGHIEADCLRNLGIVADMQGDLAAAHDYFEQALALGRARHDRQVESTSLNSLGVICINSGEHTAARTYLEQSLHIQRQIGNLPALGNTILNLGTNECNLGNWDKGQDYFEQALQIYRQVDDVVGEALALDILAYVFLVKGEPGPAWEYNQRALEICIQVGDADTQSYVLMNQGWLFELQGSLAQAAESYEQALHLREELDAPQFVVESLARLAHLYLIQADMTQAVQYVEACLALLASRVKLETNPGANLISLFSYQVLKVIGDPRAAALLESGYRILQERAGRISDPADRRSFLNNVPLNRDLLQAYAEMQGDTQRQSAK